MKKIFIWHQANIKLPMASLMTNLSGGSVMVSSDIASFAELLKELGKTGDYIILCTNTALIDNRIWEAITFTPKRIYIRAVNIGAFWRIFSEIPKKWKPRSVGTSRLSELWIR